MIKTMKTMNKISRLLLMGALVCGLGLSVTSCKDDDEEKIDERIVTEDGKTYVPDSLLTDHERYQLACQSAVIGTMRNLAGLEIVTPEVASKTYEPTYGMTLDDAGATVRVMKCESTEAAELSFRAIASLDSADAVRMYTPTADGYVLNLKDLPILADGKKFTLGTLTFHRDGGPRRYGWVDVDIPCIPHLERIDYLGPDAFPDNANCPYQIGDIVWVYKDHGLCSGYYVCVATNGYRSTLCHMNKTPNPGDDESINADGDSKGAWKPYNNDHGHATTVEDIKDYVSFMAEKKALVTNIKAFLNGKAYNKKPSVSGKLWHIFPDGFNNDKGVVFNLNDRQSAYVYYDAYVTDEYAWSPPYNYRKAKYAVVPNNCTSESQVWTGAKTYVKDKEWDDWLGGNDYTMNVIHTSSVVNYSTLEYSPLNDKLELGVKAVNATKDDVGKCYADDGILYENALQAQEYGHTPLGIVVYVQYGTDWGKKVVEPNNGGGHGLVMSYTEKWQRYSDWEVPDEPYSEDYNYSGYIGNTHESAWNDFSGYDKTQALEYAGLKAASLVSEWKPEAPMESSGWFIPTTAQWGAALCSPGLGGAPWPSAYDNWTSSFSGRPYETINKYIYDRDSKTSLGGRYWTSSARGAGEGVIIEMKYDDVIFKSTSELSSNLGVYLRPFFAF
jgi:hypothetical protein